MSDPNDYVAHYLDRLRRGDAEDAFFSLMEGEPATLPPLMAAFAKDENRGIRARIVECIWQHRRPEVIGFLGEVLDDSEPEVWKEALNGLVAIGGAEAAKALQAARARIPPSQQSPKAEWLDEALEQVRECR